MMNIVTSFIIYCSLLQCLVAFDELSLGKFTWYVRNSKNTIRQKVTIPGGIFSDLQKSGILNESIYYRFNDVAYRWVAKEDWIYYTDFTVENSVINKSNDLVFHGLDGHATITFNQKVLGKAINSFIRYRFDVSKLLQSTNHLQIKFESPMISANHSASRYSHSVPPSCVPPGYHGECHVNFLRRMPASFGWDWGLAVPSVGIWKHAELVTYKDDLIIRDITVSTILHDKHWKVRTTIYCDGPLYTEKDINGEIDLILFAENNHTVTKSKKISLSAQAKDREVSNTLTIFVAEEFIHLWWPNGYGSQNLYNLTITLKNSGSNNMKSILIGFRTAELVQELVNEKNPNQGRTFFLRVNNVDIFAKGSNYIPSSILPEESSNQTRIRNLLQATKMANMNILRVWGGGIYENDYFYEMCDRLGILIWQDMMFTCSMYPSDNQFLSSVSEEISQQIRRLQRHPSIVIWAGNNENEAALSGDWYNTRSQYQLFKSEYIKLYINTIKNTVMKIDSTITFLGSSPGNGIESDKEGYISKNPFSPLYGDVHYYNYLFDSWVTDFYPMTRFASEYGFQSLPSFTSLQNVATDEDLASLNSQFMRHRQHLPLGYLYMVFLILLRFSAPELGDLKSIIYLSQIHQAWSVKSQSEWYRKWRSTLLPNGEGRTMGAMYWQLNDVWQAPSWSSIEFDGKWKMLHYYAKQFFASVIVTADLHSSGKITVNIISDLTYDLPNIEFRMDVYKWDSMNPVGTTEEMITVMKEQAAVYLVSSVDKLIESIYECKSSNNNTGEKCFLKMTLTDKSEQQIINENYLFPVSFKKVVGLQNPRLKVRVESCNESKTCTIIMETDAIALFVWLEAQGVSGYFSNNGFIMVERKKKLWFQSQTSITPKLLTELLSVTVLDKKLIDTFSYSNDTKSPADIFLNIKSLF